MFENSKHRNDTEMKMQFVF